MFPVFFDFLVFGFRIERLLVVLLNYCFADWFIGLWIASFASFAFLGVGLVSCSIGLLRLLFWALDWFLVQSDCQYWLRSVRIARSTFSIAHIARFAS